MSNKPPVTIVGKAKSAEHAQEWIDRLPGSLVCTINCSSTLLREDQEIDYCVFSHIALMENMRAHWHRVGLFLSPDIIANPETVPVMPMAMHLPDGFPRDKWISTSCRYSYGHKDLVERLVELRQLIWHHTTAGALSWLISTDHRHIRIIGVGDNTEYAAGASGLPGKWDFGESHRIIMEICRAAKKFHGTKIEWFNEH